MQRQKEIGCNYKIMYIFFSYKNVYLCKWAGSVQPHGQPPIFEESEKEREWNVAGQFLPTSFQEEIKTNKQTNKQKHTAKEDEEKEEEEKAIMSSSAAVQVLWICGREKEHSWLINKEEQEEEAQVNSS